MNLLTFLYISIFDWFYRDGKPRHPNSIESSDDRAAYVLSVGFILWLILIDTVFSYLFLDSNKLHFPKYWALGLAATFYLLNYLLYIRNNKYETIYKVYKEKYGPNTFKYQLIGIIAVIVLPAVLLTLIFLFRFCL